MKAYEGSLQHYECLIQGKLTKADLLAQDWQIEPALGLLNEVVESVRSTQHVELLARALKSRARCNLIAGGSSRSIADDLKESLALYRTLGDKVAEVELYELYARWLGERHRFAEALQTWEEAYRLAETLRLHFRSLHMLLGIADLQLILGNKAELTRIWDRVNKFVIAHKDLPEPTQLRYRIAQMDYLKFQGNEPALRTAYAAASDFVKTSKLTAYQTRGFSSYRLAAPLAIGSVTPEPEPAVNLQPILFVTHVSTGELAHARFGIFNPSSRTAQGIVKLAPADLKYEWTPTDQGWKIKLNETTNESSSAKKQLTIGPGNAAALYFEALPLTSGATNRVSVTWQGDTAAEAAWQFSASVDSRTVAIVDASLAAENPFHAVPFYHEIYFRGTASELRNFRVKTSEPCRVEFLDPATDKLLAIDATGDGSFDGAGDVLYMDRDGDRFPDFAVSESNDAASLELLVYPASQGERRQRQIEIRLFVEENSDWTEQAIDTLVVK
jgi:tetratricopeptide (TPR) repeat protein